MYARIDAAGANTRFEAIGLTVAYVIFAGQMRDNSVGESPPRPYAVWWGKRGVNEAPLIYSREANPTPRRLPEASGRGSRALADMGCECGRFGETPLQFASK